MHEPDLFPSETAINEFYAVFKFDILEQHLHGSILPAAIYIVLCALDIVSSPDRVIPMVSEYI
jgi:hypothetical protein